MEKKLHNEMQWDKSFVAMKGANKEKMLKLAEKQREVLDQQYRQAKMNKAKMEEKQRRQEKLSQMNKEGYRNNQIELMERNQIDPKIIEAARIRAEDSDESESDDEIIIEKKKRKQEVVKKKLNLSDNFFHGNPLIKKPPINPFSFNIYEQVDNQQEDPEPEIIVKKKKKKKKKRENYPIMPFFHPDMLKGINADKNLPIVQQPQIIDNSDSIAELQKAMSLQNNLLGNMLQEFGKMKEKEDWRKMKQSEDILQMEMKFNEFDRHHNAVRGINALKNDLDKASNEAGLARIRAGYAQEEMMNEFRKQIDEVKRMDFGKIGMRSLKNFHNPVGPIIIDDGYSDDRRERKKKKKRKKEKKNKGNLRPQNNEKLYNEDDVRKITDKLVKEKLKEALEARENNNQRENKQPDIFRERMDSQPQQQFIQGPNGITIVKSKNKNEAPLIIMPEDGKSTTLSSKTGTSKYSRRRYNPMDDFMNKMLMMNLMNQKQQRKKSRSNSRRKYKDEEEAIVIPLIDDFNGKSKSKKKKKKKKKKQRAGFEIEPPRDNNRNDFDFGLENTKSTFQSPIIQPVGYDDPPVFENKPNKIEKPVPKKEPEPDKTKKGKDSQKKSHREKALIKFWKVYTILKYLKMREQIYKGLLSFKYSTINKHYNEDIDDVTEKSLYMFKKKLEPISKKLIVDGDYDINIDVNDEARGVLRERIIWIMKSIIEISEMKYDKPFQFPIILSFLCNFTLPDCYIPDQELTQFEFERIPFATTGLTKDNMTKEVSKMLIGGFLIVKMLCFHLFFRTYEYHSTVELDKNCKRYFKLIGLVIYTAYIELFLEKTPANPDNINEITMINEIPGIITSPLYYKQTDEGKDIPVDIERNFIVGAPTINDIEFLQEDGLMEEVMDLIDEFCENMYDQVKFQSENESLPKFQNMIDDREYLAGRSKEIHPNYTDAAMKWVRETRIRLNLDESANYR